MKDRKENIFYLYIQIVYDWAKEKIEFNRILTK